jgi:hypothetical protein
MSAVDRLFEYLREGVEHDAPASWFGMVVRSWEPEVRREIGVP